MESLLGATLIGKGGVERHISEALAEKEVVGLYFSAHWCPPCRAFTPKLAEVYKGLVEGSKSIQIVFVSSDRDQSAFVEYFGEQPWLALPFSERDRKAKLSKKYGVSGIPTLVLLNGKTGELITKEGRAAMMEDPTGAEFPWTPPTLSELLGNTFKGPGGTTVDRSAIAGKKLALYFSAHWCRPCRGFTPKLAELYNKMKATAKAQDFEFIFVSSDEDEASFNEYFGEMPWLALPFGKRSEKEKLSRHFGVSGIPALVTLDADLKVVNKNARGAADNDAEGALFPWAPKPMEDLTKTVEANGFDVNEKPALIALFDGVSDTAKVAEITAAMHGVAEAHAEETKSNEDGPECLFFTAPSEEGPVGQIKHLCGLPSTTVDTPTLLLLDIPDNGGFYTNVPSSGISTNSVRALLADYKAKNLERQQLKRWFVMYWKEERDVGCRM